MIMSSENFAFSKSHYTKWELRVFERSLRQVETSHFQKIITPSGNFAFSKGYGIPGANQSSVLSTFLVLLFKQNPVLPWGLLSTVNRLS